jgi:hypothetical protein
MLQTFSLQQIQGGQQIEVIQNETAILIFARTRQPRRSTTTSSRRKCANPKP